MRLSIRSFDRLLESYCKRYGSGGKSLAHLNAQIVDALLNLNSGKTKAVNALFCSARHDAKSFGILSPESLDNTNFMPSYTT